MAKGMYLGVGNTAKSVTSAYIGIGGVAKEINKIYTGDTNGLAREVYSAEPPIPLKTFAEATEEELVQMVTAADQGKIDLYDDCGWRVGQERTVSLAAIAASGTYDGVTWGVGEAQSAQTITLVLMHKGLYDLVSPVASGRTKCSFVVGLKNSLATLGYMNSLNTNVGSWSSCARRNWCNGGFRGALPTNIRALFKQFKCITGDSDGSNAGKTNITSNDYFALPAEKEIAGVPVTRYSTNNEQSALTQFTWYTTSANGIKNQGDSGSVYPYFERSPAYRNATQFGNINTYGNVASRNASTTAGISPFGCI